MREILPPPNGLFAFRLSFCRVRLKRGDQALIKHLGLEIAVVTEKPRSRSEFQRFSALPAATGSVSAANVIGPNAQGITPGADSAKVVQGLREGAEYVNVHTMRSQAGEIRGQVRPADDDGEDR